jgi:hypothetical protein
MWASVRSLIDAPGPDGKISRAQAQDRFGRRRSDRLPITDKTTSATKVRLFVDIEQLMINRFCPHPVRTLGAKLGHYPARVVFYTSTTSKP